MKIGHQEVKGMHYCRQAFIGQNAREMEWVCEFFPAFLVEKNFFVFLGK